MFLNFSYIWSQPANIDLIENDFFILITRMRRHCGYGLFLLIVAWTILLYVNIKFLQTEFTILFKVVYVRNFFLSLRAQAIEVVNMTIRCIACHYLVTLVKSDWTKSTVYDVGLVFQSIVFFEDCLRFRAFCLHHVGICPVVFIVSAEDSRRLPQ